VSFALKIRWLDGFDRQLQKAQKKGVDGKNGGPYKPPLPDEVSAF
jgi:hypothetical protein